MGIICVIYIHYIWICIYMTVVIEMKVTVKGGTFDAALCVVDHVIFHSCEVLARILGCSGLGKNTVFML